MAAFLPRSFRFSPFITFTCVLLAAVMLLCSRWQWRRYGEKLELVRTYQQNSTGTAESFPINAKDPTGFNNLLNRRVKLSGRYDYSHQMIVTNREHRSGPGHWLLTPMEVQGTGKYVIVSRGFIPFEDRSPDKWGKYTFDPEESLDGVLKKSIGAGWLGPSNPPVGSGQPFQHLWFFPEIEKMAEQLPYAVIKEVFIQRIGGPLQGEFPAESITIDVPPQVHFGYTIEWIALAVVTLIVGFVLQAFPRRRPYLDELVQE